jgi:hypothetical protein
MEKNDLVNEIDQMSQVLVGDVTVKPEDDSDDKEEETTEEEETEGEEDESEADDESEEEAEEEEESEEETEEDSEDAGDEAEPDEKDKIIAELRAKLDKQSAEPDDDKDLEDKDFVSEMNLDYEDEDKAELNKAFNAVYKEAVQTVTGKVKSLSSTVYQRVVAALEVKAAAEKFYEDNEDLVPFKTLVGNVFTNVKSDNPDASLDKIMKITAEKSREALKLPKKKDNRRKAPKLPRKKGSSGKVTEEITEDPLQDEINSMDKALGGF